MNYLNFLYVAIISYLLGCIQTSYIIGRLYFKKDIRQMGNGNAGASNALVVFGRRVGLLTGIVDILKGFFAVLIAKLFFSDGLLGIEAIELIYIAGFFVVIGHDYPFYLKFRGGKGTATMFGVLLAMDYKLFLVAAFGFILVTLISDYIVLGTATMVIIFIVYTILYNPSPINLILCLIASGISFYKHLTNYKLIAQGKEKSVRASILKKDKK